jgi:hypothetical protein
MNNRLRWDVTATDADDEKVAVPQRPRSFGA